MISRLTTAIAATPPTTLLLSQSALFITLWQTLSYYVTHHGPIRSARLLSTLHNRLYSLLSLLLLLLALSPSHDLLARRLYHASKFYEYLDILLVRASGGSIDLHFGVHHSTTMYMTSARVLHHSEGWRVFAVLNTAHHVLMYAYFGGGGRGEECVAVDGGGAVAGWDCGGWVGWVGEGGEGGGGVA